MDSARWFGIIAIISSSVNFQVRAVDIGTVIDQVSTTLAPISTYSADAMIVRYV